MTTIKLINYLEEQSCLIQDQDIQIEKILINKGNRFHNKLGISFEIKMFGQEYSVGFYQETLDREEWDSAQTKFKSWCKKNSEKYSSKSLYYLLENFKIIRRNRKINQILK